MEYFETGVIIIFMKKNCKIATECCIYFRFYNQKKAPEKK